MVSGNFDLSLPIPPAFVFPANDTEPLTIPVPLTASVLTNVKFVILPPPFICIVTSLAEIGAAKFCCWKLNSIDVGVASVSITSSNAMTCESKLPISNLADVPSSPSGPCLDLTKLIILSILTLPLEAFILTLALSAVIVDMVTVFPLSDALTPAPLDDDIT